MKEIELSNGHKTLVDNDVYEWACWIRWYPHNGYAFTSGDKIGGVKKTPLLHRLIMNAPDNMDVDHKNRNKLDNRRENLRLCTPSQNLHNAIPRKHSSKYKGVFLQKSGNSIKWRSDIHAKPKRIYLGVFSTEREAALAYDKAAKEHYGEFARTNFPNHNHQEQGAE